MRRIHSFEEEEYPPVRSHGHIFDELASNLLYCARPSIKTQVQSLPQTQRFIPQRATLPETVLTTHTITTMGIIRTTADGPSPPQTEME